MIINLKKELKQKYGKASKILPGNGCITNCGWILPLYVCSGSSEAASERFDNNEAGLKALDKWLKKHKASFDENSLLVIENTGVHHRLIGGVLQQTCIASLHTGNATPVKRSFGIACGNNDKTASGASSSL